jgi:hypothetical protein
MSLYLLQEAGALLSSGATAGAMLGDNSPAYMPNLPWRTNSTSFPPPLSPPMTATRVPAGTPPPPSPYTNMRTGNVWGLSPHYEDAAGLGEAGSGDGTSLTEAQIAAARAGGSPPPDLTPMQLGIWNSQQPTVPGQQQGSYAPGAPAPIVPTPRIVSVPINRTPMRSTSSPPPTVFINAIPPARRAALTPPSMDTATTGGGGGGAPASATPLLVAGGVVLALIYFGRKKKRGR